MTYPPPYYTDDDPGFALRLAAEHPFALLVADGLEATHLPLLRREGPAGGLEGGMLLGHVSRGNPIAARLEAGCDALAVFSGPHAYVSARLYDDPAANVPTWNYAAVQARGRLRAMPDAELPAHLAELADTFEGPDGWSVGDAPDYVAAIARGIVGVVLDIESVRAFRKMSANKPPAIRKRIIDAARADGEHAFADEMARSEMAQSRETR
ncbi:MAG: FMN-binding negative transcriptional regulator [Pseudomonadota bacterium]